MECGYDEEQNVFDVIKFSKVVPIERDRLKKRYAQIGGKVRFVDKRFAQMEIKNDTFVIKNTIMDYYFEYISNNNVNFEYKNKYGVWRDLLQLVKEDIENNIIRLPYDSYMENRHKRV